MEKLNITNHLKNSKGKIDKTNFPRDLWYNMFCLWKTWKSLSPPNPNFYVENYLNNVTCFRVKEEYFILSSICSTPSDIFTSLYLINRLLLKKTIVPKIQNSAFIELFGAAGPWSIYDVSCFLMSYKYKGKLRVIDISKSPINHTLPYLKNERFGLKSSQFEFVNDSVLNLKGERLTDLIIEDVLSYYLPQKDLVALSKVVSKRLKNGGFYIKRDLVEPNGPPPTSKRAATTFDLSSLQQFIKVNYGVEMSLNQIKTNMALMWKNTKSYPRKNTYDYIEPFERAGLKLVFSALTTTSFLLKTKNPRFFNVSVFKKE